MSESKDQPPTKDAPPAGMAAFVRFLRAGGTFSLADWRGILDATGRDAAEAAGELVARERSSMLAAEIVALASVQPDEALESAANLALRSIGDRSFRS